jgi:mono/diheme cytochrome c family protein
MTTQSSFARRPGTSRGFAVIRLLLILAVLGVVAYSIYNQVNRRNVPVDYANDEQHFKYGSIGSDTEGIPFLIWKAMPRVCSHLLPGGLRSIGAVQEVGMDRPIGFSKRTVGPIERVGPTCALCHTATVRETPDGKPQAFLAASAHQLNLWEYFNFLFRCAEDERFTKKNVMAAIEETENLGLVDRIITRLSIEPTRKGLVERAKETAAIFKRPLWGPGRVDTFNPYKILVFNLDMTNDNSIGTADYMTIWNQRAREGLWVHWDGNNNSVDERNLSAAMGAGALPQTLDLERIERIKSWIWNLKAPPYPFEIDRSLAAKGKPIYERYCAECHEPGGAQVGKVVSKKYLGTDPERADSFDAEMAKRMNTIGAGYKWRFTHFRATDGYANHLLDGSWLRAPYLHNGSVPTLRDLLEKPAKRPKEFYRGYDVFDQKKVGFVSSVAAEDGRQFFKFDTRLRGNGNGGHLYGTDLGDAEKEALVEYMKTL